MERFESDGGCVKRGEGARKETDRPTSERGCCTVPLYPSSSGLKIHSLAIVRAISVYLLFS